MDAPAAAHEPMIVEQPASSDGYVLHAELPTLKEMASCSVALSIWRSYISSHSKPCYVNKNYIYCLTNALAIPRTYKEDCDRIVDSLQTPASIKKTLKEDFEYITNNTNDCVLHFYYGHNNGYELEEEVVGSCQLKRFDVNWCVWFSNGTIDYAKTASKILDVAELTSEQRFVIMCQFCMKEEIEKFPLDSLPDSFISALNFGRDYLMSYWISYLKNELDGIPLDGFNSLDAFMAHTCDIYYWDAFKYFWHRLTVDEQVSLVEFKLSREYSGIEDCQDFMFSTMSWQQQQRLLSQWPVEILVNFWVSMNMPESAMWVWTRVKDEINPLQFTEIVRRVFNKFVQSKDEYDVDKLFEIWHSASDEQRSYAVVALEDGPIEALCDLTYRNEAALDFARMYLMARSEDFRKQVILRNADELALRLQNPSWIDSIVQLCLPQPADQLGYRILVMRSEGLLEAVETLFNDQKFDQVVSRMKYYLVNGEMLHEFMARLMESEYIEKLSYVTDVEKWNKLCQFIDDIFPENVTFGLNSKKLFITSFARDCTYDWNDDKSLDQMDKILATVFTHDEELQLVKNSFLDSFRTVLSRTSFWRCFQEKYFNRFLSWCLNGYEKAMAEFIRNVPVSAIFDAFFSLIEESFAYSSDSDLIAWLLAHLNNCLRYFKGVEGAREYKIEKIKDFEKNLLFPEIFQRASETCLDIVFRWAFDDNEEDVRKYKRERVVFMEA